MVISSSLRLRHPPDKRNPRIKSPRPHPRKRQATRYPPPNPEMDQGQDQRKIRARRLRRSRHLRPHAHRHPQTRQAHLRLRRRREVQGHRLHRPHGAPHPGQQRHPEGGREAQQAEPLHPSRGSSREASSGRRKGSRQEGREEEMI